MDLIIDCFLTPLNAQTSMRSVRLRDDNSRRKVQNVRADSSADSLAAPTSPAGNSVPTNN